MIDKINKLIFKNINIELVENREKVGTITSIVGITSNFILFLVKYMIGILTFSVSIQADAFNNLFDSAASLIAFIGFRMASKPADLEHPYGHGRSETISELFVSLFISVLGLVFAYSSIIDIIYGKEVTINVFVFTLLIATTLTKVWQAGFYTYVGKTINSDLLITTAHDSINDVLTNIAIIIGLAIQAIFLIQIDGFMGLALSVYIVYNGLVLLVKSIRQLIGRRISDDELIAMDTLLNSFNNILGYHDLEVHTYGVSTVFATVHIEIDSNFTLLQAHDIAESIEFQFNRKLNVQLVVHLDPVILDDPKLLAIEKKVLSVVNSYNENYSIHDFRILKHKKRNIITFDIVVEDDENSDDEIITYIKEQLSKYYLEEIQITIDRNYLQIRR